MRTIYTILSAGSFTWCPRRAPRHCHSLRLAAKPEARVYLSIAPGFFVVDIVQPVEAIADTELGDIFVTVRTALDCDSSHVSHYAQIDNELLLKVGLLCGPGAASFVTKQEKNVP